MDLNLKQWREHQQQEPHEPAAAALLPLFVSSDHSSTPTAIPTGYCFSIAQWQELEIQALIFRHIIAGASVPPQLLQLLNKTYYLHHYSPFFHQAALVQGGYWGKGAMDAEPGRCRRTDGKKWRCSRDVVPPHKYCDRHVHRGRNRSRKPVEFPSSASASGGARSGGGGGGGGGDGGYTFAIGSGGGGGTSFSPSASGASSLHAFQLNQGSSSSDLSHHEHPSVVGGGKSDSSRVLMHFFDDWPRSHQQSESNGVGNTSSTPGNRTSDFLRLSTGNVDEVGPGNQVGGPLGEALRTSTNSSSPTSVLLLHQYSSCCSASDNTSYVTT